MFFLPENYKQRDNRVFRSNKPSFDINNRNYLFNLFESIKSSGYRIFISGIDTILHQISQLGDCVSYLDYGYNIEIAKRFNSSLIKIDFDDFVEDDFKLIGESKYRKAFIVIDLLNEVSCPIKLLSFFNAIAGDEDAIVYISPERMTQKNKSELGPPDCSFRAREWNMEEFKLFLYNKSSNRTFEVEYRPQNSKNSRLDLVAFTDNISHLMLRIHDGVESLENNFTETDLISSIFSFDITTKQKASTNNSFPYYFDTKEIEEQLFYRIKNKIPSSLIRVGHGEIRLLGFPEFVHPIWVSRTLSVCLGDSIVSDMYKSLRLEMLDSFINADFLGVPKYQEEDQHWKNAIPLLLFYNCELHQKYVHSQNIHLQLLKSGFFERLFKSLDEILIIGCRDLTKKISSMFDIKCVEWIEIPGEAKFNEVQGRHYPDRYNEIKIELKEKIKPVVLVGGGVAGKVYCNWAKELGAVAIDIGSVMDIWDNKKTRNVFNKYLDFTLS